ncbi:uncharacterized protein LOC133192571 [Saccostrea echinata]|uniref:uncharacterized protein LOC133192571 n=1 Tax=Saccostrea echinata TaxID=191078 RepID=UPI002A82ECDF|nr:uncharacterized protein LOC133192571 [Saccostrea echinata]
MFTYFAGCKSILFVLLLQYLKFDNCEELGNNAPEVLVFGGNGFMGSSLVEKLLLRGYHVTVVNRGNWYWDSGIKIKPRVSHVICDRLQPLKNCTDLRVLYNSKFDVVIDFSAFHRFQIQDVFDIFQDRIGLYILISSDSVYEVCNKSHDGYTRETDAIRPKNVLQREEYAKKDGYGHRKLLCEEELRFQSMKWGSVPFVSLRLPDVIGPRDNTYRWWLYQLQISLSAHLESNVRLSKSQCQTPLSLVHSDDVADAILHICSQNPSNFAQGKAFNLAFRENPTLLEVFEMMKTELNKKDVSIICGEELGFRFYPTVTMGPIDISFAEKELNWNPIPFSEAVKDVVAFYESASRNPEFKKEQENALNFAKISMPITSDPDRIYEAFSKEYLTMATNRDEL